MDLVTGEAKLKDFAFSDEVEFKGGLVDMGRFFSLFEKPGGTFDIVVP